MDLSPILISVKTAVVSILITFVIGILTAQAVVRLRNERLKMVIDGILTLPLVLPPTVAGFFLLWVFGANRPVGRFLIDCFNVRIVFSWTATVLAAVVVSFPLMYRSTRGAFELVDEDLVFAARTLGMSEARIFWRVIMPIAMPGVTSGAILAFARGLGEFGATAMIAGNIAGKTRTLPLAIYSAVAGGDMDRAYYYVVIIMIISFAAVAAMNHFAAKERRYRAGRERYEHGSEDQEAS